MANLAQIQSIAQGQFFVKDSLGNLTELKVGDTVSLNDTIVAASSNTDLSKIEILFDTNELITLSQGEQLLDTTLLASTFGNEELAFDKQEVDETLNAWNNTEAGDETDMETAAGDVTEQATNAGDERAADGGALRSNFNSRESKFNSRDGSSTNVESDLREASFGGGNTEEPQEQIPTELLNPVGATTPTTSVTPTIPVPPASIPEITTPFISTVTLTSVGSGDEDGATVTYTATFTTAPVKDETVSFKVDGKDYSITVKAGELTGTTTLTYKDIDVVVDPTEIPVATDLAITNNSNYDDLTAVNSSTKFDVADSTDITKINVTAENSTDGKNIILNVSLTNKDGLNTEVTKEPLKLLITDSLGNKYPIEIPVESKVSDPIIVPNPIETGGEVTYTIDKDKTIGGNYELLDTSSTSTIVTKDIIPPVISIVGSEAEEVKAGTSTGTQVTGTVKISINKVLDNDLDVIFTHNNKEYKVTIEKGKTSVTETVETNRKDDAYKQDTTTEDIVIIKTSNDDIVIKDENGEPNIKDKITIKDDIDPVAVKITAVQTTDKVIDIKNLQNNAGFEVKAKDPYGNDAKISTHGNPAGFGVQSDAETKSVFLGQTDKVYSGHTSEIGVVKDKSTGEYLSESIEVVFKNPIQTLDVAFAWRHNGERAKVDFYNGDTKVGYAIVKGGGSNTDAIVEYYIGNETTPNTTVQAQGGTDQVDLVYTFKPANNVSFTKAVFSADGAGSDYLIHSIKYKEAVGEDNTTVVGSQEVAFKIETSKPDPIWIANGNTPTAYVTIVDSNGKVEFEGTVNLDENGKRIVTVRTDGNVNFTATVTNVNGNFEKVNYDENSVTITGSLLPTASNDSITTNEDTPYTLTKDDFGNIGNTTNTQNVAKIKFDTLPANGTIYVLKTEYTGSMNDRAEYTSSENKVYIEVKAGDIVDISQINKGNVIFVPNKDTDDDRSFKFSVSNGNGVFTDSYETKVNVIAVADAPTVSIDVEQIIAIKEGVFQKNDGQYYKKIEKDLPSGNIANNGNKEPEKFDLGGKTNSVKLDMKLTGNENGNGQSQANGKIVFYNGNVKVGEEVLIDGSKTYENGDKFDSFKIVHTGQSANETGGNANGTSSIHFAKDSKAIAIIEVPASDAERPTNDYNIDIYAALNDRDGSETLSVVIKKVPVGATLESNKYEISKNADGSYTVKVPAGAKDISDTLILKGATTKPDIEIVATATEKNDNDGSNFKTSAASDSVNSKIYTVDETSSISVNTKNTNLIFTLDITSSLVYNDYYDVKDYDILYEKGNDVLTSLHILQKSAISTIESYKANAGQDGVVNVNMTIFSKSAHNLGWMTSDQALEYLRKLTQDSTGKELKPSDLNNKLTEGTNLKPIIGQDGKLSYEKLDIDDKTTNYKNAIAETVKVDFSGKSGKSVNNVGYFISDGRPWDDASHTTKEFYSIGKDYQDQDSWNKWESFIKDNKIDLKVIGVGTPHDNVSAKDFLKEIQYASGHEDIILIDEPTSMETIFLSTVDGTVSGDVSDNIFGGDGKVTIYSIVVGGTTYDKDEYPYGLSTDILGGKLTFDFETGKYAYNGNGENITNDISKSFQVNVIDKNGDKGSLDVNFELKAQPITDGLVKFEKGGDINFSNLENIVKLKEINLDNGKENKLSLTLDDVLKLSGDDGKIKITGDQFDSVAFKNTIGENGQAQTWSKAENSIVEDGKTFEVYTNSGDESLKVKVEQPISDGITN